MQTVRDLLEEKGRVVWTIGPGRTVYEAHTLMAEKDIGALIVVEDGGKVRGIFSERDYARKVILKGASSREITVREVMTPRVFFVGPDQGLEECMALMTERRVRHLPIIDKERLVGVISIGDVVKASIAQKDYMIGQLENYIMGG